MAKKRTQKITSAKNLSVEERLLQSGTELFAEKGVSATSVREVCAHADVSFTMIHHYFGSKQGLLDAILDQFTSETFVVPLRLIQDVPTDATAFARTFELFVSETFEALIAQKYVLKILADQQSEFVGFKEFVGQFTLFLEEAKKHRLVKKNIQADMVAGMLLDRLGNQVMYSVTRKTRKGPDAVMDRAYRKKWLKANVDILLGGIEG